MKGCPFPLCNDEAHIRNVLVNAAVMARSTLLDVSSHKFDPHGVTAIALLAESHISIHMGPEKCMAVCDVFTCGDTLYLSLQHNTCMNAWKHPTG